MPKFNPEQERLIFKMLKDGVLNIDRGGNVYNGKGKNIAYLEHTGYRRVKVCRDKLAIRAFAHRLSYRYFVGEIPDGFTINHINGIKDDNRPENLEPATMQDQAVHRVNILGKGAKINRWSVKYDVCKVCHTDKNKYGAHGFCINCYQIEYNKTHAPKDRSEYFKLYYRRNKK